MNKFSIIDVVRKEIVTDFSHFWKLNDAGHQQDHFEQVFKCAVYINNTLDLNHNKVDMLFAAYFHDFFAWSRVNHHELAYTYFKTTDHPLIVKYFAHANEGLVPGSRFNVSNACRQHRASYKGEFTNQFAELINSADRCFPGDVKALLERTYNHRLTTHPDVSEDERMSLCIAHMKEKAGSNGYARYPDLYLQVFGDKLKEQQAEIDQL